MSRKAKVPVAAAAYVPTSFPRTDATAARLVQDLEVRLAPFVGLWLAAVSTVPERTRALDKLAVTIATARRWGAPLATLAGLGLSRADPGHPNLRSSTERDFRGRGGAIAGSPAG